MKTEFEERFVKIKTFFDIQISAKAFLLKF